MAEILDHGQQLDLRTRRGADFAIVLTLLDAPNGSPINLTGASGVGRIFSTGQADVIPTFAVNASAGQLTVSVSAGKTLNMVQDWQYVVGYKDANGATHPLIFGAFKVSQEAL